MTETKKFLQEIEAFCRIRQIPESKFGRLFMKDASFVSRLRGGRSPSLDTVERLRAAMAAYDSDAA